MIYNSITELVGKTPIVRLENLSKKYDLKANLMAKIEFFNPAGSVKDRIAKAIIEDAESKGLLNQNSVIIEPTSGNTGIGFSMMAAVKGYKMILTMPESMSMERRKLLKAYGAEIVLTDAKTGMAGAIAKAEELLAKTPNSFSPAQFANPINPQTHYLTTGPEIFEDTDGNIDIFVSGIGTGGTITGTAKFLKEKKETVKIVGIEPFSSPFLTENKAGPHKIQGIGAGFKPETLSLENVDKIMTVKNEDAIETAKEIAKNEGIFVGISSGASLWAGIELAKKAENAGKTIVVLLPDTGERYLSTELVD